MTLCTHVNGQTIVDLAEQIVDETFIAGWKKRLQIQMVVRGFKAQSAPEAIHQARGCADGRLHDLLLQMNTYG